MSSFAMTNGFYDLRGSSFEEANSLAINSI